MELGIEPQASRPEQDRSQFKRHDPLRSGMTYHRINKLDAIIFWWIMTRSNHHTDRLSIEFPRTQGREQANTEHNRVQE